MLQKEEETESVGLSEHSVLSDSIFTSNTNGRILQRRRFISTMLRRHKHVHDNVHGNIFIDSLSLKFIDTEQFQKLRELIQLSFTHLVYPGVVHSSFEHSPGGYCITGQSVEKLNNYQGMELGIDRFDMQTVKLVGLLHDVGHGPTYIHAKGLHDKTMVSHLHF